MKKVVIFAGGVGSRLSEETSLKPKPMVEIGGRPILWHIMKIYAAQGFNEFVVCLGFKGEQIKEYFLNYAYLNSDLDIDVGAGSVKALRGPVDDFCVKLVDTGKESGTAGRLLRVKEHLGDEPFLLTYGDGVADVNLADLIAFHKDRSSVCTMTSVRPEGRYGAIEIGADGGVSKFREKPEGDGHWINGGFFVLDSEIWKYLEGIEDTEMWEETPMRRMVEDSVLSAYKHYGFWQSMDTLRDRKLLESLWDSGNADWKIWNEE